MSGGMDVDRVTKRYRGGRAPALREVSVRVEPGELFGLIGPNGAGKTTLIGCLLGLLRPDHGTVLVDGHPPDDLEVRRATGYLPERLQFDRWMTGRQFVAYHHALAQQPAHARDEQVDRLLERVGLEPAAWDVPIKRYSRGMLQRVGLAQALVGTPRFLFLDEPASGVDPAGVLIFRRILGELKAEGVTVVLNSHQLDQIERVCDRVAFIEGGHVRAVENLHGGAGPRVLVVRWLAEGTEHQPAELGAVASRAGAKLLELGNGSGRFSVAGEKEAAALVRALVEAGVPVIEAAPEAGRLERFFTSGATR